MDIVYKLNDKVNLKLSGKIGFITALFVRCGGTTYEFSTVNLDGFPVTYTVEACELSNYDTIDKIGFKK